MRPIIPITSNGWEEGLLLPRGIVLSRANKNITAMTRLLFVNAVNAAAEVENRYQPLWPAYLSAYAQKILGPGQIEFRFMKAGMAKELDAFQPHIVSISAVSQNFNYAMEYAAMAKRHGAAVIVGGMHVSCMPHCMTPDMDIGCIGEGEQTFAELLKSYITYGTWNYQELRDILGIAFRDHGRLIVTQPRPLAASLDMLPHPNRSIIGYRPHDYMFTSRGCPYRCVFCASSRFWSNVRFASPEYVVEEIRELAENGVKTISFYDDLFVADKHRLRSLVELIVKNGLQRKVRFTCSCRANAITPDVVELLKAMNVVSVGLGLESGCEATLRYLKGNVSVRENRTAIDLLKNAGIQTNASFVIGSPDETNDDIIKTYEFIRTSRLDFFDVYALTPLPGTPVWEYAKEKDLVSDVMDWSRLNVNFEKNSNSAVILSKTLSRQDLILLYRKFRKLRFRRILKSLPTSPWLRDLPKMIIMLLNEKLIEAKLHCCVLFKKARY